MTENNIQFITGNTYTLSDLFSGGNRIIIPDLQRDYCWGDENNRKSSGETGELVSDFVNNLITQYAGNDDETLNLGLFYGYEVPAGHIQLCDGQQRFTTLFLLLGMLNKRTGTFRDSLISDFEYEQDDKEPYLNYAIRETSLYFLSDLVCQFFISNKDSVESIVSSTWYFKDYDLDPSIRSMINAMRKIEDILKEKDDLWIESFGRWMLDNLTFMYLDMEDRKNGEETFVVINTTGEPLSATQNLKPLVIGAAINSGCDHLDSRWEEIETFFWTNRNENNGNDTADAGFAEFLRWVSIIEQRDVMLPDNGNDNDAKYLMQKILQCEGRCEFPYNTISFEMIYRYYECLKWIVDNNGIFGFNFDYYLSPDAQNDTNGRKAIWQIDCFLLLPVLLYVYNSYDSLNDETLKRRTLRLYMFFKNLTWLENVNSNVNTSVRMALITAAALGKKDIMHLLETDADIPTRLLTYEERRKLEIFRDYEACGRRDEAENLLWKVQNTNIWQGQIMTVIKLATDDEGFSLDKFRQYSAVLGELFAEADGHGSRINMLRRCLIVCQEGYRPYLRGPYHTFGWERTDWDILLTRDKGTLQLLDYIIAESETLPIEQCLEKYIKTHITQSDFYVFAADSYLMDFTKGSKACDMLYEYNDWQIAVQGGTGRHSNFISCSNALILRQFGGDYTNTCKNCRSLQHDGWQLWYWPTRSDWNCVVFEHECGVKIDVRFCSEEQGGCLECVLKKTGNEVSDDTYKAVLRVFGLPEDVSVATVMKENMPSFDAAVIKEKIIQLMSEADEGIRKVYK